MGGMYTNLVAAVEPRIAAVVQHANDGSFDGHGRYRQLDSVKRQFGCFQETFHATGTAVIPPPSPVSGACLQ